MCPLSVEIKSYRVAGSIIKPAANSKWFSGRQFTKNKNSSYRSEMCVHACFYKTSWMEVIDLITVVSKLENQEIELVIFIEH